jgi:hypothetical protein
MDVLKKKSNNQNLNNFRFEEKMEMIMLGESRTL